ncbi:hypothetical protein MMC26_003536 [Xylographa opegraphella]|nr:hypothetical protein [Xylographa opegraphella]
MSSDLWAAFTGDSQDPSTNPWSNDPATSKGGHTQTFLKPTSNSSNAPQITKSRRLQKSYTPLATTESWPEPTTQHENVWVNNEFDDFSDTEWTAPLATPKKDLHAIVALATELVTPSAEEDDFGDFEEAEAVPQQTFPAAGQSNVTSFHSIIPRVSDIGSKNLDNFGTPPDIIDLDVHHDPWAGVESLGKPVLPTHRAENVKSDTETSQGNSMADPTFPFVETSVEVPYAAEEWGEFSPDPREVAHSLDANVSSYTENESVTLNTNQRAQTRPGPATNKATPKKPSKNINAIPPTNVPPPSILLSFLSNLIVALPPHITKIIGQGSLLKGNSAAVSSAQINCRLSFRVAARVITGRKLRWKRDIHLFQSMKIGPASAGRAGGMKLTGVDKAETQREDREAAEIVRVWKANLGSIRAALVASSGQARKQPLGLPDISEKMFVQTATAAEGAITATKCCFLCGLKRDERIVSLDTEVSDSLGEWWAEHWGHGDCQSFWEQYEQLLPRRG